MKATPAMRKAQERQRKKAAGLVKWEVWLMPDDMEKTKKFVADLRAKSEQYKKP